LQKYKNLWVVLLLFIVALILRLPGTSFGLPEIYHSDEQHEVYRALRLGAGSVDLSAYRAMKGGYFYLLFLEYGLYFLLLKMFGIVNGAEDFAIRFVSDPTTIWLIGRCTTAVLGAATVPLLYHLGKKVFPRTPAGLFAALFLAFSFRHIVDSHYVTVDVPMTFFLLLGFLALIKVVERGGLSDYLTAGLLLSFAVQFKIVLAAAGFSFLIAHFQTGAGLQEVARSRRYRFLVASSAAILFYLAGNPGILFNIREILSYFFGSLGGGAAPRGFQVTMAHKEYLGFRLYAMSFFGASGWLIPFLSAGGLIMAVKRRNPFDLLVLSFIIPTTAVLFSSKTGAAPRYMIPLLPFLYLYAGAALAELMSWWRLRTSRHNEVLIAVITVIALTMLPPVWRSVAFNRELMLPDTRGIAREWVVESIPTGSRILIAGHENFPAAGTVQIPLAGSFIKERIKELEIIDRQKASFLRTYYLESNSAVTGYEPVYFDSSDGAFDLDAVWLREPEYAVVSSQVSKKFLKELGRKNNPEFAAFYDRISSNRLVFEVIPSPGRHTGPIIRVYRLDGSSSSAE